MFSKYLKSLSILKKFLFINFIIFTIISLFTFLYLSNVQPNLIKKKSVKHLNVIDNTINTLIRLDVKFNVDDIRKFLFVKELAKRPGIIKERAQLMDIAYREDTDIEDRTIDSHVKRIRKKFKKVDPDFSAIETRYGSGYRWNVS